MRKLKDVTGLQRPSDPNALKEKIRRSGAVLLPGAADEHFVELLRTEAGGILTRSGSFEANAVRTVMIFSVGFLKKSKTAREQNNFAILEDFPLMMALASAYARQIYNPVLQSRISYVNSVQISGYVNGSETGTHRDLNGEGSIVASLSLSGLAVFEAWRRSLDETRVSGGAKHTFSEEVRAGDFVVVDNKQGGQFISDGALHNVTTTGGEYRIALVLRHLDSSWTFY